MTESNHNTETDWTLPTPDWVDSPIALEEWLHRSDYLASTQSTTELERRESEYLAMLQTHPLSVDSEIRLRAIQSELRRRKAAQS